MFHPRLKHVFSMSVRTMPTVMLNFLIYRFNTLITSNNLKSSWIGYWLTIYNTNLKKSEKRLLLASTWCDNCLITGKNWGASAETLRTALLAHHAKIQYVINDMHNPYIYKSIQSTNDNWVQHSLVTHSFCFLYSHSSLYGLAECDHTKI
jgi:hypothetical protein